MAFELEYFHERVLASRRSGIGRAFYCFVIGKRVVVLHAFIKKSRETPDRELKLARKRLKELQGG
jgi:phage-related protein